ncbi:uncharacterized protein RAG0_09958 [Rhynchosporium agropyri]|uniref:BTB domain-containing protein n=1 Tax=Rhynchosporium agropyri TaxID=914238 RepID=A0A1E1KXY3_9HELO|nr:uncharacterized protein RAG0_09958 [Rhynchosporium agropyri]
MSSYNFSLPLAILVGPYAEAIYINEELICASSHFFRAACEEPVRNSCRRTITLHDTDLTLFDIFISWLTTGNISTSSELRGITKSAHGETEEEEEEEEEEAILIEQHYALWDQLCGCYNLGDELLSPGFKNAVMDLLVKISGHLVMHLKTFPCRTTYELETIYKTTFPGSGLRRLVVDLAIGCLGIESLEDIDRENQYLDEFCRELLSRTGDSLRDYREGGRSDDCYLKYPWEFQTSSYPCLVKEA